MKTPREAVVERLDQFLRDWDIYGYRDSDMSIEVSMNNIEHCPEVIIDYLLDIIDELQEELYTSY